MMSLLREAADLWWAWMMPMSLQVAVLVAIVEIAGRLLRRRVWPQLLAAMWLVVLVKLVLPPTLGSPVSIARLGSVVVPESIASIGEPPRPSVALVLFLGWFAGCAILAFLAVSRYQRLRRELGSDPVAVRPAWLEEVAARVAGRLKLSCAPEIRVCRRARGPALCGFWRPVVVLPCDMLVRVARLGVEHVLLHEFAHVKRRDPLVVLACLAVQLLYWFHPAVWLVRVRLATLREISCDRTVAALLGDSTSEYRRTLLGFARRLLEPRQLGWLGFVQRHSQLLARLDWLERPVVERPFWRRFATVMAAGMLLLCAVPLARPARFVARSDLLSAAPSFVPGPTPDLDELPGCLPRRFLVLGMLAKQERGTSFPDLAYDSIPLDLQEMHP